MEMDGNAGFSNRSAPKLLWESPEKWGASPTTPQLEFVGALGYLSWLKKPLHIISISVFEQIFDQV